MTNIDKIIAYEQGDLSDEEFIALFQELVDSGLAWKLQGAYGRKVNSFCLTARALIEAGLVTDSRYTHEELEVWRLEENTDE